MRLNRPKQRYSRFARRVLEEAWRLAKTRNHAAIDATHVLMSILEEDGCVGWGVLHDLGLNWDHAETAWMLLDLPRRSSPRAAPAVSDVLQEALSLAADEAQWLGQMYIGTEHLLLAVARVGDPALMLLLGDVAIDVDQVRYRIRKLLRAGVTEISVEQARRLARLSELSRRVLNASEQLAEQTPFKQIGMAHLMLVLARERRSVCSQILRDCGFDDASLEAALMKPRAASGGNLEELLDRAVEHAEELGSHYTGTEHILLALRLDLRGARLLKKYGAVPDEVERRLREHLAEKKH